MQGEGEPRRNRKRVVLVQGSGSRCNGGVLVQGEGEPQVQEGAGRPGALAQMGRVSRCKREGGPGAMGGESRYKKGRATPVQSHCM